MIELMILLAIMFGIALAVNAHCVLTRCLPLRHPPLMVLRWRMSDLISLAILMQFILVPISRMLQPDHVFFYQQALVLLPIGITMAVLLWAGGVQYLDQLEVHQSWRRIVFNAFIFPLSVCFLCVVIIGAPMVTGVIWNEMLRHHHYQYDYWRHPTTSVAFAILVYFGGYFIALGALREIYRLLLRSTPKS